VLQIDRYQCIPNAQTAEDILRGIVEALGEPDGLMASYPQTPLEILQQGIAKILEEATESSLCMAVEAVCEGKSDAADGRIGYAYQLAREFLRSNVETESTCFTTFQKGIGALIPKPCRSRTLELLKYVRSLWVQPADVAVLRLADKERHVLALFGKLINRCEPDQPAQNYTLDRFIERAWPVAAYKFLVVSLIEEKPLARIKEDIWKKVFGDEPLPSFPDAEKILDREVNRDIRTLVLLVSINQGTGGLPDPRFVEELRQLFGIYHKIMLVLNMGGDFIELPPETVKSAQPRIDDNDALRTFLNNEYVAYAGERRAKTYLDQNFL
jgi:hypothetical protein